MSPHPHTHTPSKNSADQLFSPEGHVQEVQLVLELGSEAGTLGKQSWAGKAAARQAAPLLIGGSSPCLDHKVDTRALAGPRVMGQPWSQRQTEAPSLQFAKLARTPKVPAMLFLHVRRPDDRDSHLPSVPFSLLLCTSSAPLLPRS